MAELTQFTFSIQEATEALIKQQKIHEGKWALGVEFSMSVGIVGVSQDQARPGLMALVNNILLLSVDSTQIPPDMIVDAAQVNPAPRAKKPD